VQPALGDAGEYRFLTAEDARVECRRVPSPGGHDLQIFGNRAGLLSLANIFLWFIANAWRREFLSLGELGFVRLDAQLSVSIRLADDVPIDSHGIVLRQDKGESLEWAISEEGLQVVALWIHRLVSNPAHEYDRLLVAEGSECGIHVRMIDLAEWLGRGIA
jgi:hypothetical protein